MVFIPALLDLFLPNRFSFLYQNWTLNLLVLYLLFAFALGYLAFNPKMVPLTQTNNPMWIVRRGQLTMHHSATDNAIKVDSPGVLVVEEGYAVVLTKSGKVSRVVGRGLCSLQPFERPHMIVPLSVQAVRVEVDNALTMNGFPLKRVEVIVFSRLDPGRCNMDSDARYPFDSDLIIDKVWSPEGGASHYEAYSAIKPLSETVLRQILARHTLDEYLNNFAQTRLELCNELVQESDSLAQPTTGFRVVAAAIGKIELPEEILKQHWQGWVAQRDLHLRDLEWSLRVSGKSDDPNKSNLSNNIFLVHGHDEAAKESAARFVEKLGLEAIILHEQPNAGRTIIEKIEDHANVGFAIILLTPDDIGAPKDKTNETKSRARQNVILELGYFMGKLGRGRVCALYKEGVEIPSDYQGVLYIQMDSAGAWRTQLAKEIKNAGIDVDLNKVI
jgi:predicted nucleotide-binding protein